MLSDDSRSITEPSPHHFDQIKIKSVYGTQVREREGELTLTLLSP